MAGAIEFTLNGRLVRLENLSPNSTLLEYLRQSGLAGSKEGCAEGDCGACSVAVVDRDAEGRACYRAINSCLVPVSLLAGREIISVEGVASKAGLHPVQNSMAECHGSQCGYCTPGFILSLFEGYYRKDLDTPAKLDDQLCGNLCRCTGYRPIRQAAADAFTQRDAQKVEDGFARRLKQPATELGRVEYDFNGERFFRPTSLAALLELRKQFPDARLIAGATELGLEISKHFKKFAGLISVEAVPELKEFKCTDLEWHIGAAVTLTEIEDRLSEEFPALGDMLRVFGSRQIRNRATMGGNLVTASPIGDSAPVLLAMDARLVFVSLSATDSNGKPLSVDGDGALNQGVSGNGHDEPISLSERTIPIDQFFVAYRKTALRPEEVLKTIVLPRNIASPRSSGPGASMLSRSDALTLRRSDAPALPRLCRWYKVSKRREMDISTIAVCLAIELDSAGDVTKARLAYGGVAAVPARALQAERALLGKPWNEDTIREVLPILAHEFTPISDVRGSAEYRRALITSLFEKFYFETGGKALLECQKPSAGQKVLSQHTGSSAPCETELSRQVEDIEPCRSVPHESAQKHVTGEAIYADDQTVGKGWLEIWPVCSPDARARILKRDASAARAMPGIKAVLLAEDIPGENNVGAVKRDEVLLADKVIEFHGQLVALVVGESQEACRAAADKMVVEYKPLPPILTLQQALSARSFHNEPNFIRRGKIGTALAEAPLTLTGTFELEGQEHFYLETHAAWAECFEDGAVFISSSTQHPSEVQTVVAHVLGVAANKVVVQVPRMGGGFGGKETQAATPAALAALAAHHARQPVRVRWNRDQDMMLTGHRHPFLARFKVGFDAEGRLLAARIHLYSNAGWSMDLSQAVTDRALFHLDNAYYIPSVEFRGQTAKTNLSSNTAFRGFGGPQGMLVIEEIIDRVARRLGLPPELVRERNLYRGKGQTNSTHYGEEIGDNRLQTLWRGLKESSNFEQRRCEIAEWNNQHPHLKRGLAITPVKFGISFTVTHLNQAGAFVVIYQDGTVQVNHGGTEMGQGVHTNIVQIASQELGVSTPSIRIMPTSTDKVPNTSATAASCGTDLNGAAVKNACEILRTRLLPVAVKLLKEKGGKTVSAKYVTFRDGEAFDSKRSRVSVPFKEVVRQAYLQRISLSTTGYYATPGIHWDRVAGRGKPFLYFACGAAVAEVEVDGFTGMTRVNRVDILHDVGDSINEGINRGQIEGGFIQGMGWLTTEELKWDEQGRLLTHSPDTYKIPSIGDVPQTFNVSFLKNATQKGVIYGSKAVGEPPLMLAISVREAIRDAVAAFGNGGEVQLASPATCEAIFMAIQAHRKSKPETAPLVAV